MRRLILLALALVMLLPCTTQPGGESPSATPIASSCRLPVTQGAQGQGSGSQQPGFLELPGSRFTAATGAADGWFYDRAMKRWVQAAPPALSADGVRYAYISGDRTSSTLHTVDVRSGLDSVVSSGGPWSLVGIAGAAVYVMKVDYQDTAAYGTMTISRGLWQVPLDGNRPVQLTADSLRWTWADDRAVYGAGSTLDVAGGPSPLVRFDLGTRKAAMWFESPARTRLLGVDAAGAGLAISEGNHEELWRVPPTGEPVKVWSGATDGLRPEAPVAVDGSDVWFSSSAMTPVWAIYHYSTARGLERVATFTDRRVSVAGPCA